MKQVMKPQPVPGDPTLSVGSSNIKKYIDVCIFFKKRKAERERRKRQRELLLLMFCLRT